MNLVKFKTPREEKEFQTLPPSLKLVADSFISISIGFGVVPVITRILAPVLGESGIHQQYCAVDFRDEQGVNGPRIYSDLQAKELVDRIEKEFPRRDGKRTIIHHAFVNHADPATARAPYHFHIQINPFYKFRLPEWWKVSYSPQDSPLVFF